MNEEFYTNDFYRRIHNFPTNRKDYRDRIRSIIRRDQEVEAANQADPAQWTQYYSACNRAAHLQANADKYAENFRVNNFFTLYKEVRQLPPSATLADLDFMAAVNIEMRTINDAIHLAKQAKKARSEAQSFLYGEMTELMETEVAEIETEFLAWREDCRSSRRGWNDKWLNTT